MGDITNQNCSAPTDTKNIIMSRIVGWLLLFLGLVIMNWSNIFIIPILKYRASTEGSINHSQSVSAEFGDCDKSLESDLCVHILLIIEIF